MKHTLFPGDASSLSSGTPGDSRGTARIRFRSGASRLVQEETLDLALVNMNFYEIDKLNSYEMLSDQIVFCVSPEHPLASCKEVTMERLKEGIL